jgi:hypothetical protein
VAGTEEAIKAIWKTLDEEPGYVAGLTQELVRIPSVNPKFVQDPEQNREAAVKTGSSEKWSHSAFRRIVGMSIPAAPVSYLNYPEARRTV